MASPPNSPQTFSFQPGTLVSSTKVEFTPADLKIRPNNYLGSREVTSKGVDYQSMLHFIHSSPIHDCIMNDPEDIYLHLLAEFWWTCDYHMDTKSIVGTILDGTQTVTISSDSLRPILLLPQLAEGEEFETPATLAEWKAWLPSIGYYYNVANAQNLEIPNSPLKSHIPGVWRLLFTHVIQCLGGNSGSYNQASTISMPIIHALATGRRVDYTQLIFDDMVQKVSIKNRSHTVPFSRFFSLVFKDMLGENYEIEGAFTAQPPRIGPNVYKAPAELEVAPFTAYMQQVLHTSFPSLYPDIAGEAAPQKNEAAVALDVDTSLPKETGSLEIPPATTKVSKKPTKRSTMAKSSTLQSSLAAVPKQKRGVPKGKTTISIRSSSLPKDTLDQPTPSAISKQIADETQGQQQAATPISVGGVGEDKGSPQPTRGQSPPTIIPTSKTSESLPEHAESPAALEVAKSAADESLAKQHAEDEAPIFNSPIATANEPSPLSHGEGEATHIFSLVQYTESSSEEMDDLFGLDDKEEVADDVDAPPLYMDDEETGFVMFSEPIFEMPTTNELPPMPSPPHFSPIYTRPISPTPSPLPQPINPPAAVSSPSSAEDEELLMEIPPPNHPDFWRYPIPETLPSAVTPKSPTTKTTNLAKITTTLQSLSDQQNKLAHIIGWLAEKQGAFHADFEQTSLGQALQSQNIRESVLDLQRMSTELSDNQRILFNLENEVLRGNQEIVGHRMKRLCESHSHLACKIEGIAALLQTHHEENFAPLYNIAKVAPTLGEIRNAVILLAAQTDHLNRSLTPIANQITSQTSKIDTLSLAVQNLSATTFSTADRTLIAITANKQRAIETEMTEMKGTLSQILLLLQAQQIKTPAEPVVSMGEKADPEGEDMAKGEKATAEGEHDEEEVAPLKRKGKRKVEEVPAAPADISDKLVRKVLMAQRLATHEQAHKEWKKKMLNEGPSAADDQISEELLAAAQGVSIETVREQARLAAEEEASYKLVKELAAAELSQADVETKKLVVQSKLSSQDILKRKQAEFEEKKEKAKAEFLGHMQNRKRKEKIIGINASMAQQGKVTNLVITRAGDRNTQHIADVQKKSLGATEWIEVYDLIKNRTAANFRGLHKMLSEYFDNIRKFEEKHDIKDSILKCIPSSEPSSSRAVKRKKTAETSSFFSTLPVVEGDELLTVSLPAGITFEEGKVINEPAGMFYSTVHGYQRFFRLNEVSIASTKFLMNIRKRCAMTSNNLNFIAAIDQELSKGERLADPAYSLFKEENVWD